VLVRHGSLRERRQVSPLLRTFATSLAIIR
jgi:hypothetical protein